MGKNSAASAICSGVPARRRGVACSIASFIFAIGPRPSWGQRVRMKPGIATDFEVAGRDDVVIVDYHTGLGPYGYGKLQCEKASGLAGYERGKYLRALCNVPLHGTKTNSGSVPWGTGTPMFASSSELTMASAHGRLRVTTIGCSCIDQMRRIPSLVARSGMPPNCSSTRKDWTGRRWYFGDHTKCRERRSRRLHLGNSFLSIDQPLTSISLSYFVVT